MSAQLMKVSYSRLFLFGLVLAAAGGCSESIPTSPSATVTSPAPPPPPPPSPAPPQASAPQRLAALALFEAASLHEQSTTSPLTWATEDGKVWTNGPCAGNGSLQGSLDGGVSPTSGTFLPTGSHTYVVSFTNCLVHWVGIELNGVASAAYTAAEWSNITATVSADSVRGQGLASGQFSELYDVTADGSAVWTRVGPWGNTISSTITTTYTPATGSRLVNNSTSNVATFGGGSYSAIRLGNRQERRFEDLKLAVNGTDYTLNGSLETTFGSSGPVRTVSHTGEIRIINNGTLVARIYGDARNALTIEVLVPLVPF